MRWLGNVYVSFSMDLLFFASKAALSWAYEQEGNRVDLVDRPPQVKVALDWVLSSWPGQQKALN
jgi:hypothetical protein